MRFRLILAIWFVTALSAAAQTPVKTVTNYIPVYPPAELHFVDGNIRSYPIMRISQDMIRVESGDSQSLRMPLTYLESIRFNDGCTIFFDKGEFRFDKLATHALLKNESGDALLEGVLKLDKFQTETLMGPEYYPEFRKNSRILKIGVGTLAAGTIMSIPFVSTSVLNSFKGGSPAEIFNNYSKTMKGVTIGGGCLFIAGIVVSIIGNSGCNRVVASYNNGVGLAYTF